MAKILNLKEGVENIVIRTKNCQIKAAEDELDRVLGAIQGWQNGSIKTEAVSLLDLIKEDILDYFRRQDKEEGK